MLGSLFADGDDRAIEMSTLRSIEWRILDESHLGVPQKHRTRVWSHGQVTDDSVLILHGLYESPHYLKSVAEFYFAQGFNVVSVLLSTTWVENNPQMFGVDYHNWLQDAEFAWEVASGLGRRVHAFGFSTGGLLAMRLALDGKPLKSLSMAAPALGLSNRTHIGAGVSEWIEFDPHWVCGAPYDSWGCKILQFIHKPVPAELADGLSLAPRAGREVKALIEDTYLKYRQISDSYVEHGLQAHAYQVLAEVYSSISVPVFMLTAGSDTVVSIPMQRRVMRALKSPKRWIQIKNMQHGAVAKGAQDVYQAAPEYYNHQLDQVLSELADFLSGI